MRAERQPVRRRVLIIALLAGIAWALVLAGQIPQRRANRSIVPESHPLVTQTEFSQIRQGMSYEDCVRIIGAPGDAFGSSGAPADHHDKPEWVSYVWRNSPDSYAQISFHDGLAERLVATNLP